MRKITITIIGAAAAAVLAGPATLASASVHAPARPAAAGPCAAALAGYCGQLRADNGDYAAVGPGGQSPLVSVPAFIAQPGSRYATVFAFLPSDDTANNGKVVEWIDGSVVTSEFWRENPATHVVSLKQESLAQAKADPNSDLVYTGGCAVTCDGPFEVAGTLRLVSLPGGNGGPIVTVPVSSANPANVDVTFLPHS